MCEMSANSPKGAGAGCAGSECLYLEIKYEFCMNKLESGHGRSHFWSERSLRAGCRAMLKVQLREIPSRRAHELLDRSRGYMGREISPRPFPMAVSQTVSVETRRAERGMGVRCWICFRNLRSVHKNQ